MQWKRTLIERTLLKPGKITSLKCYHCYRKRCERHQTRNNKFLLEKTMFRFCVWFVSTYDRGNEENHGRGCGYGKKKRRRVKAFKVCTVSWKNSRADRHHTKWINRTQFDEDGCFWNSARQWGRRHRRISTGKQIGICFPVLILQKGSEVPNLMKW